MTAKFGKEKEHHITGQNEFGGLDRQVKRSQSQFTKHQVEIC